MIYRFRPAPKTPDGNVSRFQDPRRADLNLMARHIFAAGMRQSDPAAIVQRSVRREGDCLAILSAGGRRLVWPLSGHGRVWLLAAGKAAAGMADALYSMLGPQVTGGLVVTPEGSVAPACPLPHMQAGHPKPDVRGMMASRVWSGMLRQATRTDLVLVLLSGGASALLPAPVPGVSIAEKALLIDTLLTRGASIHELNTVRKHLSMLKGGRMVPLADPAQMLTLVLSDVSDDDLSVVASGPTVPDPTSFVDALAVLTRHELVPQEAPAAWHYLQRGADGLEEETPKPGDPMFRPTQTVTLADNRWLLNACASKAREMGLNTLVLDSSLCGEARLVGQSLAERVLDIRRNGMPIAAPACLIGGGETTVRVIGNGLGGRNQELALAASIAIAGCEGVALLSAASDGVDGPTSAAGAIAFGDTLARARLADHSPHDCLNRNDSNSIFDALGDLVVTGPTGTNLLDVQIGLVLPRQS